MTSPQIINAGVTTIFGTRTWHRADVAHGRGDQFKRDRRGLVVERRELLGGDPIFFGTATYTARAPISGPSAFWRDAADLGGRRTYVVASSATDSSSNQAVQILCDIPVRQVVADRLRPTPSLGSFWNAWRRSRARATTMSASRRWR